MTAYYVATLACYVLVNANNEAEAHELGKPALQNLYAESRERVERYAPIEIHTVRPATEDEVELMNWHTEIVAREAARSGS